MASLAERIQPSSLSDEEIVERVLAGDTALFEIIMRRYNQRLYRIARSILRDDAEAEDVMQDAYVRAYQHLNQFAGRAKFSTWLTRIAVNEALARQTRRKKFDVREAISEEEDNAGMEDYASPTPNPEQHTSTLEMRALIEKAVERLPERYRTVFMLRDVEEMNTADTAFALQITEEAAKVRLHRARALLRRGLYELAGTESKQAFTFNAIRCDRVVRNVFDVICGSRCANHGLQRDFSNGE